MIISQIWSVLHEFRLVRWLCASFNSPRLYSIVTGRTQKQTPWHSSEHSSAKSKKPSYIGITIIHYKDLGSLLTNQFFVAQLFSRLFST